MKSLPVFALTEVEADLRSAMAHYASWRTDGAAHVVQKYDETIGWIAWNPEAFPRKHGQVRRAILKQAYYIIYFIEDGDRTVILAVLDGRRGPQEIQAVLKGRKPSIRRSGG
ncbi:MAG: type II toxin-antitoxin system RelE/ParE family toxin [Verrucomicrobiota bacterium]